MKPVLEKIISPPDQSFDVRIFSEKYFTSPWHFHPQIEIILITKGYGTRFVGDSVRNFYPGDLCVIGSNTPHVFLCNKDFYQSDSNQVSEAICIHFRDDFWGTEFLQLGELKAIKGFLAKANRGQRFIGPARNSLAEKIKRFPQQIGPGRIIHLLDILQTMTEVSEMIPLSSPDYTQIPVSIDDIDRMGKLFDFVLRNFNREIRIEEVATLLNISRNSFCRYFKSRTHKVFSEFLSEVRIGNACKLLIENKLSIAQISYESGFNNLSNFYRQFKQIKEVTPSEFQKKYLKNLYIDT